MKWEKSDEVGYLEFALAVNLEKLCYTFTMTSKTLNM